MSKGDSIRELFKEESEWSDEMSHIYASQKKFEDSKKWRTRSETIGAMLRKMEQRGLLD